MTWAGLQSLCKIVVYNYTYNWIIYNTLKSLFEFMQKKLIYNNYQSFAYHSTNTGELM